MTHVMIDSTGENVKRSKAKAGEARGDPGLDKLLRQSAMLKRQTPGQTAALKEALFNKYFDEVEKEQQDRSFKPKRVHRGEYFLMMNFPSHEEDKALQTSKTIEKIRHLLRQELKSERTEQEAQSAQQKTRHEGWQDAGRDSRR